MFLSDVISSSLRLRLFLSLSGLYHCGIIEEVEAEVPRAVLVARSLAGEEWLFDWVAWYWSCGLNLHLFNRIFNVFITSCLLNGGKSFRIWPFLTRHRETDFKICILCWVGYGVFCNVFALFVLPTVLHSMLTEPCVSCSVVLVVLGYSFKLFLVQFGAHISTVFFIILMNCLERDLIRGWKSFNSDLWVNLLLAHMSAAIWTKEFLWRPILLIT